MAFSLQATLGSTTISLSNGSPYTLLSARGMAGANAQRVTRQGPAQDGDTDLGYRLQPREMELVIGFKGSTDTVLDGYRDTLMSVFRPLSNTATNLRVTRDDGEIRQIDCYLVGSVRIELDPMLRPGHYHRATIRLRAPDPAYYELAPGTASVLGSVDFTVNWWLAGGAIGTAQVLMSGSVPSNNEAWSYAGSLAPTTSFTLATRAVYMPGTGTVDYRMFTPIGGGGGPIFGHNGADVFDYTLNGWASDMNAGTGIYFYNQNPDGFYLNGVFRDHKIAWIGDGALLTGVSALYYGLNGATMRWRTTGWTSAVPLYALYSPALSESQRNALSIYMTGIPGTIGQTVIVPYEGDLPEYPIISITGPITGPSLENQATGDILDFGTITIGAGTTYVIDTRYGYKTVKQGATNVIEQLTDDSDLATWHLAPAPIAGGGTNVVAVYGNGINSATNVSIVYYNRFASY